MARFGAAGPLRAPCHVRTLRRGKPASDCPACALCTARRRDRKTRLYWRRDPQGKEGKANQQADDSSIFLIAPRARRTEAPAHLVTLRTPVLVVGTAKTPTQERLFRPHGSGERRNH